MSVVGLNLIRWGSWLIFLAAWLLLLFQMITRWGVMSVDLHYDGVTFLVLIGTLWGRIAKEKSREFELFCISVTTVIVLGLIHGRV